MAERKIITDKIVLPETGKDMETWFLILDKADAKTMSHTEIYELTGSTKGLNNLNEWNRNLFTTSYEWSRGLKARGEKSGGFETGSSKTLDIPINDLYACFTDTKKRKAWLDQDFQITKSTENKSIRALWHDGVSRLSIDFYEKSKSKTQVVVQHLKIKDEKSCLQLKEFWTRSLAKLAAII